MVKLIVDTNFLIYLAKYKLLDKIGEYKLILLKQVLQEIIFLSKNEKEKIQDRDSCNLVLQFLKSISDKVEYLSEIEGNADNAIVDFCKKNNEKFLVGTMDKELISRLKKEKIKILIIRQKKLIEEK